MAKSTEFSKESMKNICHKAGATRIGEDTLRLLQELTKDMLKEVLVDAAAIMQHSKRKTLMASDIIFALERRNVKVYGY